MSRNALPPANGWTREPAGWVNGPWLWVRYEQGQRRHLVEPQDTSGRIKAAVNPHRLPAQLRHISDLSDSELENERLHWLWEVENATKWSAALQAAGDVHAECVAEMQRRGLSV